MPLALYGYYAACPWTSRIGILLSVFFYCILNFFTMGLTLTFFTFLLRPLKNNGKILVILLVVLIAVFPTLNYIFAIFYTEMSYESLWVTYVIYVVCGLTILILQIYMIVSET
jgi:hypothetical protein